MILKLKYFLLLFLLAGLISSEAYGYIEQTISIPDNNVAYISEYQAPDQGKAIEEPPIMFLFHNMLIRNTNYHSQLSYILTDQEQLLLGSIFSYQKTVSNIFIQPLRYYIYTLEKIVT